MVMYVLVEIVLLICAVAYVVARPVLHDEIADRAAQALHLTTTYIVCTLNGCFVPSCSVVLSVFV